jgi:hypothetical protein
MAAVEKFMFTATFREDEHTNMCALQRPACEAASAFCANQGDVPLATQHTQMHDIHTT